MIPATFGYTRASTIDDAVAALASSDDAKVLGGGQSLLPVLRLRLNAPELVVDCSGIDEIKSIDGSGDRVVIGSGATHHARGVRTAPRCANPGNLQPHTRHRYCPATSTRREHRTRSSSQCHDQHR